jgi:hypothetical protein
VTLLASLPKRPPAHALLRGPRCYGERFGYGDDVARCKGCVTAMGVVNAARSDDGRSGKNKGEKNDTLGERHGKGGEVPGKTSESKECGGDLNVEG